MDILAVVALTTVTAMALGRLLSRLDKNNVAYRLVLFTASVDG